MSIIPPEDLSRYGTYGETAVAPALGAPLVIATQDEDLGAAVRSMTGKRGIQAVFDAVGGSQVETIAAVMAPGGVIVSHGALGNEPTPFPLEASQQIGKVVVTVP